MNTETTTLFTQHNLYRHYEHWDIHIIGNIIMYTDIFEKMILSLLLLFYKQNSTEKNFIHFSF